jgi:hypothetical protein
MGGASNVSEGQGSKMGAAEYVQHVAKYFGDVQSRAKMFRVKYQGSEMFTCVRSVFARV